MSNFIRQRAIEGLKENDSFTYSRTFTREETETFGDITRDYNPIHYDSRWVDAKGFKDLICHGLIVGSMICEFGGQVGWLATGMTFKFINPVYFGDTITCTLTIDEMDERGRVKCSGLFVNQHGETVIDGQLYGILPNAEERALLAPPSV